MWFADFEALGKHAVVRRSGHIGGNLAFAVASSLMMVFLSPRHYWVVDVVSGVFALVVSLSFLTMVMLREFLCTVTDEIRWLPLRCSDKWVLAVLAIAVVAHIGAVLIKGTLGGNESLYWVEFVFSAINTVLWIRPQWLDSNRHSVAAKREDVLKQRTVLESLGRCFGFQLDWPKLGGTESP